MSVFPLCHPYRSSAVSGFPVSCKAGSPVLPTAPQLARFSPFPCALASIPARSRNFLLLGLVLPDRAAPALAASQCQGAVLCLSGCHRDTRAVLGGGNSYVPT